MASKAVFLDRDRTIIEDPGYISAPGLVKLLPGADLAVRSLREAGYTTIVVTNQSGIARGLLTVEMLEKIHAELRRQLAAGGAHIDAIYYCPFHPEGTVEGLAVDSELRKPRPGMLLKAAKEYDIDLAASWMVGDSGRDVEAGQRAGCRTIRLRSSDGSLAIGDTPDEDVQADFTVRNLLEASRVILREASDDRSRASATKTSPDAGPAAGSAATAGKPVEQMNDREILMEILHRLRQRQSP